MAQVRETLSVQEKAFAEEMIRNGFNATQAYRVGYQNENYTTCNAEGYKVANRPRVKAYIEKLQKEAYEASYINAERVAMKLAEIAFSDKGDDNYNATAKLKALDLLQKQLNIQHQKIDANMNVNDVKINITE